MVKMQYTFLFLTRVALGWLMFYAGITKVLNPEWSAAFYLKGAKTFPAFYTMLLSPSMLPIINFVNAWGLTLLGLSLLAGFLVRVSAPLGALLMMLYYFPVLDFPRVGEHSYLIDEHIMYALVLLLLAAYNAGTYWGLDRFRSKK